MSTDSSFNGAGPAGSARVLSAEDQIRIQAARLEQQLEQLTERNKAGFAALGRQGIQFDPGQILNARIDVLIQSIAQMLGPRGVLFSLQARLDFESIIAEQQQAAGEQGRKAQLGVAGNFTPEMIRRLAAETGTPGS
jgi:hypothetical protein